MRLNELSLPQNQPPPPNGKLLNPDYDVQLLFSNVPAAFEIFLLLKIERSDTLPR